MKVKLITNNYHFYFQLQVRDYDFQFEEQFVTYKTNQFDEYHQPEQLLDRDPTKHSLKQVIKYFLIFFIFYFNY